MSYGRSDLRPASADARRVKTETVTGDVAVQVRGDSAHGRVVSRLAAKPDSIIRHMRIPALAGSSRERPHPGVTLLSKSEH